MMNKRQKDCGRCTSVATGQNAGILLLPPQNALEPEDEPFDVPELGTEDEEEMERKGLHSRA